MARFPDVTGAFGRIFQEFFSFIWRVWDLLSIEIAPGVSLNGVIMALLIVGLFASVWWKGART